MIMAAFVTVLLRILLVLLGLLLLWVIVLAVSALFVNPNREYDRNSPYYRLLLNTATAFTVHLLGIHVEISGLEKLPESGPFLLVGNHRSNFDPILTWYALKDRNLAFISKPENFRIPLFGRIIRRCCFLPIDREDPRNAIRTIHKSSKLLKKGQVNIAVYPEGTRSKDGTLLPFHNGVFKIALKADAPIVILAIQGTETIHKNWFRRHSHVRLTVVDVLPAESIRECRTAEIGDRVRDALTGALGLRKEAT